MDKGKNQPMTYVGGNDEGDFHYTFLVLGVKFIEANRCITLQEPLFIQIFRKLSAHIQQTKINCVDIYDNNPYR
jgi:hypothetical protein